MEIISSAEMRTNYNKVADRCRETGEPIYLTKNGKGELVVMDIASFEAREQLIEAQLKVLDSYAASLAGAKSYTNDEVKALIQSIIKDVK